MKQLFEISKKSGHGEKYELLSMLLDYIKHETIISTYDLELVLDEALTNAMEHGNKWNESKQVHVSLQEAEDSYVVKVRDEGSGFEHENHPLKLDANDVLRLRGRGICTLE